MPENQTQGAPADDETRPSDTEAAHRPDGNAVRDSRLQSEAALDQTADQNHGSLDGHPSKDLSEEGRVGERLGERGHRLGS